MGKEPKIYRGGTGGSNFEMCEDALRASLEWKTELDAIETIGCRISEHVLFAPRCSVGPSLSGLRVRDWALIELHPDEHQFQICDLKNVVELTGSSPYLLHETARKELPRFRPLIDPEPATQILNGIISEDEIKNPRTYDKRGEPLLLVAKFGRTTDLTIGISNGVESVQRTILNHLDTISAEWCIVGRRASEYRSAREDFSASGDSGYCIQDLTGRITGIVTIGLGKENNWVHDVTHATPIDWLLNDISTEFGVQVELA